VENTEDDLFELTIRLQNFTNKDSLKLSKLFIINGYAQCESKYIWYELDGNNTRVKDSSGNEKPGVSLAWASCNITSLCMILHYFGITDETPDKRYTL
jgi:hypothetical protein